MDERIADHSKRVRSRKKIGGKYLVLSRNRDGASKGAAIGCQASFHQLIGQYVLDECSRKQERSNVVCSNEAVSSFAKHGECVYRTDDGFVLHLSSGEPQNPVSAASSSKFVAFGERFQKLLAQNFSVGHRMPK